MKNPCKQLDLRTMSSIMKNHSDLIFHIYLVDLWTVRKQLES